MMIERVIFFCFSLILSAFVAPLFAGPELHQEITELQRAMDALQNQNAICVTIASRLKPEDIFANIKRKFQDNGFVMLMISNDIPDDVLKMLEENRSKVISIRVTNNDLYAAEDSNLRKLLNGPLPNLLFVSKNKHFPLTLSAIAERFPNIADLDLNSVELSEEDITILAGNNFRNLESISFVDVPVSDEAMARVTQELPKLKNFRWVGATMSADILSSVAFSDSLELLAFDDIKISNELVITLSSIFPYLKDLYLGEDVRGGKEAPFITDEIINALASSVFRNSLEKLKIDDLKMTFENIMTLMNNLPNLKKVSLETKELSPEQMKALGVYAESRGIRVY